MKIARSEITVASGCCREQRDRSYTEMTGRAAPAGRPGEKGGSAVSESGILIDRVSISSAARHAFSSRFASRIDTRSTVTVRDIPETVSLEQTRAVETAVGRLIDQAVLVRQSAGNEGEHGGTAREITGSGSWEMQITRADVHYECQMMSCTARGSVITEDGRAIDFSLALALEQETLLETYQTDRIQGWQESVSLTDPLVISLSGRVPELTDMTFSFDIDCDGVPENISFLKSGSGFLSLDKNSDNRINDGSELFGPGTGNGFGELSVYDTDSNGWIDENDAVFDRLSVWTKDDSGQDRLISLKDAGIGAISLQTGDASFDHKGDGNVLKGRVRRNGIFLSETGGAGIIQQIDLASRPIGVVGDAEQGRPPMVPLTESLAIRADIDAAALKKMNQARRAAGGSAGPAAVTDPPENRFKELIRMIEKLKKEFEKTLNIDTPAVQDSLYRARTPDRASFLMPNGSSSARSSSMSFSSPTTSNM